VLFRVNCAVSDEELVRQLRRTEDVSWRRCITVDRRRCQCSADSAKRKVAEVKNEITLNIQE
jgi:hypothetical protein